MAFEQSVPLKKISIRQRLRNLESTMETITTYDCLLGTEPSQVYMTELNAVLNRLGEAQMILNGERDRLVYIYKRQEKRSGGKTEACCPQCGLPRVQDEGESGACTAGAGSEG